MSNEQAAPEPESTAGGFGMTMVGLEGGIGGVLTVPAALVVLASDHGQVRS
jgi:hypothetical protein